MLKRALKHLKKNKDLFIPYITGYLITVLVVFMAIFASANMSNYLRIGFFGVVAVALLFINSYFEGVFYRWLRGKKDWQGELTLSIAFYRLIIIFAVIISVAVIGVPLYFIKPILLIPFGALYLVGTILVGISQVYALPILSYKNDTIATIKETFRLSKKDFAKLSYVWFIALVIGIVASLISTGLDLALGTKSIFQVISAILIAVYIKTMIFLEYGTLRNKL